MKRFLRKYVELLKGRDKGTVAITFLLSLPVLLAVISVLVQFALLATARMTVDRAAAAAARSAMTSLPTDPQIESLPLGNGAANVNRAALMVLESLSPASPQITSDAGTVADALAQAGVTVPSTYAARYSFAQNSMQLQIQPVAGGGNFAAAAAPKVRITITYDFLLTVPVANLAIGRTATVGGITGRFLTMTSTLDNVQLSPGREVPTNDAGEPQ